MSPSLYFFCAAANVFCPPEKNVRHCCVEWQADDHRSGSRSTAKFGPKRMETRWRIHCARVGRDFSGLEVSCTLYFVLCWIVFTLYAVVTRCKNEAPQKNVLKSLYFRIDWKGCLSRMHAHGKVVPRRLDAHWQSPSAPTYPSCHFDRRVMSLCVCGVFFRVGTRRAHAGKCSNVELMCFSTYFRNVTLVCCWRKKCPALYRGGGGVYSLSAARTCCRWLGHKTYACEISSCSLISSVLSACTMSLSELFLIKKYFKNLFPPLLPLFPPLLPPHMIAYALLHPYDLVMHTYWVKGRS